MADQDTNKWIVVVMGVFIALIIYLVIDSYYADPLTRVASVIDATIDEGADITEDAAKWMVTATGDIVDATVDATGVVVATVVDAAGNVVDMTVDATGAIVGTVVDAAGDVVDVTIDATGAIVDGAGRVVAGVVTVAGGALSATGDALISVVNTTGDALVYAGEAIAIEIDEETGETKVNGKKITPEMHDALVQAGAISSPMEGNMLNDMNGVRMSEDSMDSEELSIEMNGGAQSMGSDGESEESDGESEESDGESGDENSVEGFYYYNDYPRYCTHCGGKGRYSCNNCVNCGYCITPNGTGECVSGDSNGPHFRKDCVAYEHNSNGYRIYKRSPYRYLTGLPYFRQDGYYHDFRGYPYTKYSRRHGSQLRRDRLRKHGRRAGHVGHTGSAGSVGHTGRAGSAGHAGRAGRHGGYRTSGGHRAFGRHDGGGGGRGGGGGGGQKSYGTAASKRTRDVVNK